MEQQVITDISLSARIIGAAFYYPPTEKSDIVELLSSGKWLTEWPYGSRRKTTHCLIIGANYLSR